MTREEKFEIFETLGNQIFNLDNWISAIDKMIPDDAVTGKIHKVDKPKVMSALKDSINTLRGIRRSLNDGFINNL